MKIVRDRGSPCAWILLSCALVAFHADTARACSGPPGSLTEHTPAQAFADADAVLSGTVLDFDEPFGRLRGSSWIPEGIVGYGAHLMYKWVPYPISARVEVEQAWKGVDVGQVRVWADAGGCGSGMQRLEPGDRVLIFAFKDGRRLATNVSYRPELVDSAWAREAIAQFGPGRTDLHGGHASVLTYREWIAVGVASSILGVIAWWRRRRERELIARALV